MMDERTQRRAYRNPRRGFYGGAGGIIWLVVLIVIFSSHSWILWPLLFFGVPFFLGVIRPRLFGSGNQMNQPPYQQNGPIYQPPVYQPPVQQDQAYYQPPEQQDQPAYQPYSQGYGPQASATPQPEIYQEAGQQYQYPAQQNMQQQYEEPLTMYPQE